MECGGKRERERERTKHWDHRMQFQGLEKARRGWETDKWRRYLMTWRPVLDWYHKIIEANVGYLSLVFRWEIIRKSTQAMAKLLCWPFALKIPLGILTHQTLNPGEICWPLNQLANLQTEAGLHLISRQQRSVPWGGGRPLWKVDSVASCPAWNPPLPKCHSF